MLSTVLIHAAAGVTTICAARKIVLIHDPSSKPRPSAPRISARPTLVSRTLRVEMNAPTITATTPITGYSERGIAGSGIGAAAVVADTVMAAAGWYR